LVIEQLDAFQPPPTEEQPDSREGYLDCLITQTATHWRGALNVRQQVKEGVSKTISKAR
jgi:hypothetical protein